jgi:thioredoxin-related protein
VTDNVGRQLAMRYGVRGVPTLVLLDGNGDVVLRQAGSPRREEILTAIERLPE